jgi:Tfp pilus assembly protein PilZ
MEGFDFNLGTDSQARAEIRRPLRKRAQLSIERQILLDAQTVDISHGGVCIMLDRPVPIGQNCSVTVDVFFKDQQRKINLEGKVVYCMLKGMDGYRTGIRLMQLDDEGMRYVSSLFQ